MAFVENQGARIYWDEQGHGAPVLLIMGLGYTSDMWYRIRPLLAAHYRTIALDNRGVGRSDVPAGPYSIALMASDAATVLDAAGTESAHVFGVSMGGMIAQEFALQYPKRVRSLILGCTAAGGPTAVRAEPEAAQMLMTRDKMSPEQAAEAAVPFIYDSNTPRERIDEGHCDSSAMVSAARSIQSTAARNTCLGGVQPPLGNRRPHPADPRGVRPAGAAGQRKIDRGANSRREARDDSASQPSLLNRPNGNFKPSYSEIS